MNVIFLTMARFAGLGSHGIYSDLMRQFRDRGHQVYIVTPHERSLGLPTRLTDCDGVHVLGVRTLNLQKTNVVEKGIGQVLVEGQYRRAIRKYLGGVRFDLILYSTPPITFPKVIAHLWRRNPGALTYLLLKDIFPQNAVDIGMMSRSGPKGLLYRFFRRKERRLYGLSDHIGCMSPANVEYVLAHNPEVGRERVEVAPNSIELTASAPAEDPAAVRGRYGLPTDRPIFIYGGNLGRPQGIPYLMACLEANKHREDCHFVVVGTGTEYPRLAEWHRANGGCNVMVMPGLPKAEYDGLVRACDVGLIFLDHRFTIPNYPSRLLSYMENRMPILCATDPNTDIGRIAEENGYGMWCESVEPADFTALVDRMLAADRKAMGERGYRYLCEHYTVEHTYNAIVKHLKP